MDDEEVKRQLGRAEEARVKNAEAKNAREQEAKRIKAEYHKVKDSEAIVDLRAKLASFIKWHVQLAKDAIGFDVVGESTKPSTVRFSPAERLTELDKAAGLQEIVDYLDRQFTMEPANKGKTNG